MVSLTVEDGAKSQIPLPDNGSRTISASGNADKIVLTIHASIGGRVQVKKAVVKVTRNVVKTERVHHRTRSSPGNKKIFDLSKIASWWNTFSFRMKTTWAYMPEDKRMAYITLGLITFAMLLTSLSKKLTGVGFIMIVSYLMWIILKR